MKADTHPEYIQAKVDLFLRQHLHDPLDQAGAAHGALQRVPPVLYRQAEARRHRRPGRAFRAPLWPAAAKSTAVDKGGQTNPGMFWPLRSRVRSVRVPD